MPKKMFKININKIREQDKNEKRKENGRYKIPRIKYI